MLAGLALAADATDELPVGVQAVLAHRGIPAGAVSIHVENLSREETVLSWHADTPRVPASIMKLLTTLVALEELGPAYRWSTDVHFLGELRDDGTLDGDLLLKGHGDPYLVAERLWQLQRRLRAAGLERVTGDLLLDDSHFELGHYDPGAFDREPLRAYNVAPNALLANYKVVSYTFTPAADGRQVDIALEPPLDNLEIVNRLEQVPGACRGYQRGIAINANETADRITFRGRFPAGCDSYRMGRTALSHLEYTGGLFRSLWAETGGSFGGRARAGRAPDGREPDLEFESLPLAEIVRKVNKHSNNVMARQLLFTLGAEAYGPPGTEDKGRRVVADWLAANEMDFGELSLDNGAGLSRDARVTARHMVALLRHGFSSRFMPEFVSSLPLSGLDGTLKRRLERGGLAGRAHMKTGSLDHVSSIAGYLLGRAGERYAVAIIVNHEDAHRGTGDEVQDALLRWLRNL